MKSYIFVVGGVMSGVGKGVATASIARVLQNKGYSVTAIKIDAYINVDAGTMNPTEHGEVFVTDDGYETDQDMGNYERFLNRDISSDNYMTTGRVYLTVIERERNLEYQGKCVEVVPHIPDEVIRRIKAASEKAKADITMIEIGGTVGEYQNLLFLEAARMMKLEAPSQVLLVLVSYLPVPDYLGEMKTKPTQYAARSLNSAGIQADFIMARASKPLDEPRRNKLAVFCNVRPEDVVASPDVKSIYEIPALFDQQNLGEKILNKLGLKSKIKDHKDWSNFVDKISTSSKTVKIGIIGKYFGSGEFTLADSYISVIEAVKHAAYSQNLKPEIDWLSAEDYEKDPAALKTLNNYHGIIVPGGFGSRGIEGKILAIQYCRENKIPYFGLCYGMQLATIEFSRNVAGLKDAHTLEVNSQAPHPVIHFMPGQDENVKNKKYGASMRLGAYPCKLAPGSISQRAYSLDQISERHRHRYEFNNEYRDQLTKHGLVLAGLSPDDRLVEIIELKDHPFFVGTQFHPEFKSRPLDPHPLFVEFIKASINRKV
ncbi:CTP synthase [Candidatus Uhrbacteria bacterium]|nr:CTP synthase [Candidatus Uhrbacteria bacterium]